MRSLLKEPFVQFVILGLLLFVGNGLWERHFAKNDFTITVDPAEMERQAIIFAGENRRQPTDEDLTALLFSYVEEEALVREAGRMGLGEDDTIIRRRLAQKMRFLIEDTGEPELPPEADLREWYTMNHAQFIEPAQRSFSHIYLSPEKHGDQIGTDAEALVAQITEENWKSLGDPFMLNRSYNLIDEKALAHLMGANFAQELFKIDTEEWQNPIGSAFGLHLVKVTKVKPKASPSFESIQDKIKLAWRDTTRRAENNQRLRDLIDKYKVEVEE